MTVNSDNKIAKGKMMLMRMMMMMMMVADLLTWLGESYEECLT